MVQAWSRACKQKQYGQPTYLDVQREVNLLRSNKSSAKEEQAYRAYRNLQSQVLRAWLLSCCTSGKKYTRPPSLYLS